MMRQNYKESVLYKAIKEMKSMELTGLLIKAEEPLPLGTIQNLKAQLFMFINTSFEVVSEFDVEVDQIQRVFDDLCKIVTKTIRAPNGIFFETIPDNDHWKKAGTISIVMATQLRKLIKHHPDLPHIHKFINDFRKLLGKEILCPENFFIDNELAKILEKVEKYEVDEANLELFKFRTLYDNLIALQRFNSPFLKGFIKKLQNCLMDQYHGIRMEIGIADKLHSNGIRFTMPDPPDFLINWKNTNLKIECTSRHLSTPKNSKYVIKGFITAIEAKNKCSFVDSSSALFIDASNLSYNNPKLFADQANTTRFFLKEKLDESNFGNLTVFTWISNIDKERYENIYNRIDAAKISPALKELLDNIWPMGWFKTSRFAVPIVG